MLLGVEVVMTLLGLYMLCTGSTFGKAAVKHWQVRLLGLFVLSFWPVTLVIGLAMVIIWGLMHPQERFDRMPDPLLLMTRVLEVAMVVAYYIAFTIWEKRIRAKVAV